MHTMTLFCETGDGEGIKNRLDAQNSGDIRSSRCITGVADTGGQMEKNLQ
jgi:hypothetical protein